MSMPLSVFFFSAWKQATLADHSVYIDICFAFAHLNRIVDDLAKISAFGCSCEGVRCVHVVTAQP